MSLNGDHHINAKLQAKGQDPIKFKDRQMLVTKATAEHKWLGTGPALPCSAAMLCCHAAVMYVPR